jgi:hypothetical protein
VSGNVREIAMPLSGLGSRATWATLRNLGFLIADVEVSSLARDTLVMNANDQLLQLGINIVCIPLAMLGLYVWYWDAGTAIVGGFIFWAAFWVSNQRSHRLVSR